MKVLIATLLLILVASTSANVITESEDFLRGFVRGSLGAAGQDIVDCIQDGEEILFDIFEVAKNFEQAAVHFNKDNFEKGLEAMGDIITLLPREIKECGKAVQEVKGLEKIIIEFTHPTALIVDVAKKIVWHGRSIYKDVTKTVADFKEHNYEDAGYRIGDLVKILFLNSKKLSHPFQGPIEDASSLVSSFWKSAFGLDLPLQTCEDHVQGTIQNITETVKELSTFKDIQTTIETAKKLLEQVKSLYEEAHECEKAWPIIEQGVAQLKPIAENPLGLVSAVTDAAKAHPIVFYTAYNDIKKALSSSPVDYAKLGKATGNVVSKVLQKL